MQFFTLRWLSPYIGSWLLFQGAINLSIVPGTANLVQSDEGSAEVAEEGKPAMTLSSAAPMPKEAGLGPAYPEQPPAANVQQPWRLPNTAAPLATVRVTEREAARLSYAVGGPGPNQAVASHCVQWDAPKATATLPFQVRVNEQVVAEFPQPAPAYRLGKRLQAIFSEPDADAAALAVALKGDAVVGQWQQQRLFTVDPDLAERIGHSTSVVAVTWANALRDALGHPPLPLKNAAPVLAGLVPTDEKFSGTASWYGPYFHGRTTANGETFNQNDLTAAHPSLPFDTQLKVTNQLNGRSVVVRINDRGPYIGRRSLDLSRRAASCLNSETKGVVPYSATILEPI